MSWRTKMIHVAFKISKLNKTKNILPMKKISSRVEATNWHTKCRTSAHPVDWRSETHRWKLVDEDDGTDLWRIWKRSMLSSGGMWDDSLMLSWNHSLESDFSMKNQFLIQGTYYVKLLFSLIRYFWRTLRRLYTYWWMWERTITPLISFDLMIDVTKLVWYCQITIL